MNVNVVYIVWKIRWNRVDRSVKDHCSLSASWKLMIHWNSVFPVLPHCPLERSGIQTANIDGTTY